MRIYKYVTTTKAMLFLLTLALSTSLLRTQPSDGHTDLLSSQPIDSIGDLSALDEYFSGTRIVGMGEANHGTHEFFTNKHRVFQYLVEEHGFNTFFMEADYSNCLRIDNYIKGAPDSIDGVVRALGMWPWITGEMKHLITWMRAYNLNDENDKQLSFIGCDMQRPNTTIAEINNLLSEHSVGVIDLGSYTLPSQDNFFKIKEGGKVFEEYRLILSEAKKKAEGILLNSTDKYTYETLVRHFDQIIEVAEKSDYQSLRDVKMAENILYHLAHKPETKGFFWAHNFHICNIYDPKRNERKSFATAGGILRLRLGSAYFIIGQEFIEGEFNAYFMPEENRKTARNIQDFEQHKLGVVEVNVKEEEVGFRYKNVPSDVFYITPADLPKKQLKRMLLHNIGADYYSYIPGIFLTRDMFDVLVIVKTTTASKLLKR